MVKRPPVYHYDTCHNGVIMETRFADVVPVGQTGTIPFEMRRESADFPGPGAACDKTKDGADGCRW